MSTLAPSRPTVLPLGDDAWAELTPEPTEAELIALRSALAEMLRSAGTGQSERAGRARRDA